MKKILSVFISLLLLLPVFSLAACANEGGGGDKPPVTNVTQDNSIRLRSNAEQSLNVGNEDKIIYDAKADGKVVKNGVTFTSSDPAVVTVDEYGNVVAVGVGDAVVTLALKNDAKITAKVTYHVSKTFFMTKAGYVAGNVDLSTAELEGWVKINEGEQSQVLVSECSEHWYFKAKVEHSGRTGADSSGRWGVGSFLVDDSHALGNVMMWLGFQPTNHADKQYTPYVGGWRVASGNNDPEITIAPTMQNASSAVFELIRYGATNYCTVTVGNTVAKYVYETPSLDGKPTYPGVYSQRQELYISEYEAVSGQEATLKKLANFQCAEEVAIAGLSDKLFAGQTYDLVATVLPDYTYDKNVTFALKTPVDGVTVTEGGALTVGDDVTGDITVVVTATSGKDVTAERTYTVSKKAEAQGVFDVGSAIGVGAENIDGSAVSFAAAPDKAYLPLNVKGEKWAVSYTLAVTAGSVGLYGIKDGYTDYVSTEIKAGELVYGAMTGKQTALPVNGGNTGKVTVLRDGSFYSVIVDGALVERFYSATVGQSIPALYFNGTVGTVSEVTATAEAEAVDAEIAKYPFTIGKQVAVVGEKYAADAKYTLKPMNFPENVKKDNNWPPVNNYQNGVKFATTTAADYSIEFKLSAVTPLATGGKIDSKILVYLRSETKTASLQFVIKSNDANPANATVKFCPNLNDATWTEYDMPEGVNIMGSEPTAVKVEKRADGVAVYINGARVFEGNSGLTNAGYWSSDTLCTAGIGTFLCGVTLQDISFTAL